MSLQKRSEGAEARLRRRIEKLRNDQRSGSSLIADRALSAIAMYARYTWDRNSARLVQRQAEELRRAHRAMALIDAVAQALATALADARSQSPAERGRFVAAALQGTRREFADARSEVAQRAAEIVAARTPLLLLSHSGSVIAACAAMRRRRPELPVVVCESRPRREGVILARQLAETGCRVTLITDAAMGTWVDRCGAVLLGCDRADRAGFVNKTGSLALSVLAESVGRPVFVLVDRFRISPRPIRPADLPHAEPTELLPTPNRRIKVDNPWFEYVPWGQVHLVVTERGLIPASRFTP